MAADNNNKAGSTGSNRSASRSGSRPATAGASKANTSEKSMAGSGSEPELTAVDKKWGVLFDSKGQPTSRFVEAMSSLFRYIIDAFVTAESIVLVPEKMASFYNFHIVDKDPFRYQVIFHAQARGSHRSLAELYQDLGCAFHLVQASPASPPRIPGLTRDGFSRWMALLLQAFPDEMACRLERVISDFPLETTSAIDGKSERLPKQLSRYLLPKTPDLQIRALLQQAVKRHFGEAALASMPPPPPPPPPAPKPTRGISFSDGEEDNDSRRRRKPDEIIAEHRRYNSYSGPVPPAAGDRGRDPAYGRRGRREDGQDKDTRRAASHSRSRQPRRSTEPSRRHSVEVETGRPQRQSQPSPPRRHHSRHSSERPRSRNLPLSLLDAFLQPGRSPRTRGPSPQSRSYRASLPEIHNAGAEYSGHGHRDSMSREARGHGSEPSSRRSSYIGPTGRGSIDSPPSSAAHSYSSHRRDGKAEDRSQSRPKLREVCYKAIERRDRDDKSYRLYGSSLPQSPLSTSPVLQYASGAPARDEARRRRESGAVGATVSANANTKAKLVGGDAAPAARGHARPRSPASLQPTVVADEDGNGSDSDQTWDEYLRSSDSQ